MTGQVVDLPDGHYRELLALGFGTFDLPRALATLTCTDGSTGAVELPVSDWTSTRPLLGDDRVALITTHIHQPDGDQYLPDGVFAVWPRLVFRRVALDPDRQPRSLTLPTAPEALLLAVTLVA